MKTLLKFLVYLLLFVPVVSWGQSGPPAPGTGIYAILDTTYDVGTFTQGVSRARITLKNTTAVKYTAVQFRVFYDKSAFSNASVALVGSSANLDLQQVVNTSVGYVTITLVYTGSSSTYTLADGETFEITFTHVPGTAFYALPSIANLTWSAVVGYTYQQVAAAQSGLDTPLSLHSYGGQWVQPVLKFRGTFTNVTGTAAKNLTLALEKKVKTSSTWSTHKTYTTNVAGKFSFTEIIDTSYYDVRLAVKGDTMNVGNVISTADAQLINQWVIEGTKPAAWNFYSGDVNGDNNLTISDAYGVFGRISGRFTTWPNSVKDVKFFTPSEYATVNSTPTTNFTSTIPGVTNFYYNILPGQPDSVVYYVLVPGDANGTGYRMARTTPIEILINPGPGIDNQIYNVIDNKVEYDFPTSTIEVNVPRLSVQEGNAVNLPVKVLTNGEQLNALQFGLKYDNTLLEFKGISATSAASKWITYINANDNRVDWGGYDNSNNTNLLSDGDEIVTFQFIALKPQNDWGISPLWTTDKFAGKAFNANDLTITPTNNVIQVFKMIQGPGRILDDYTMEVFPNPTSDEINISFKIAAPTKASLKIYDLNGKMYITVLDDVRLSQGQYKYNAELESLIPGVYTSTLVMENGKIISHKIVKQN